MYTSTNITFLCGTPTASIENYQFWNISLKLLMWTWFAFKRRICSQRTRLLNSESSVLFDVIDQCRRTLEGGGLIIYIRKQHKISYPQATNSSAMGKLTIEIPTPNSQTWYLHTHYLQRMGIPLSVLQPDIKVHEVVVAVSLSHQSPS